MGKEIVKINRIKVILIEKDMSQKKFAELLGRTETSISGMLNNITQPRLQDFPQIAEILGVKMNELINE